MSVDKSAIIAEAKKRIVEGYDLPEEFISSIDKALTSVLGKYHIYSEPQSADAEGDGGSSSGATGGSGAGGKEKKEKSDKPRKNGAYTYYVQEMMQDPKIKEVPPKERMKKISELWKNVTEEQKKPYQKKADEAHEKNLAEYSAKTVVAE